VIRKEKPQHLVSLILKRLEEQLFYFEDCISLMMMAPHEAKTKVSKPDSWKWIQELYVGLTHWTWLWLMLPKVLSMPQVTLASYPNCTPCSRPPHSDGPLYHFSICTGVWYDILSQILHVIKLMQSPSMHVDVAVSLLRKTEVSAAPGQWALWLHKHQPRIIARVWM
jgi:hypothetical protein